MAQSLPSVFLPSEMWVDLYDATGIAVGTPLTIQNTGSSKVSLSESVTEPTANVGKNIMDPTDYLQSADVPVGI